MADIEIEIDGKTLKAKPDAMVIQVADEAGIYIPRFCYHKHLTIAANCRMCLVEVDKVGKTLPACATPVTPGMKVFTRSQKAMAAQKSVMEFLLINHPLDCPICDQGGECELQDLSLGYGSAESYYSEGKRAVKDEDIGPLIATEMTRCIQCTRCVRFGEEIAGMRELGAVGRGEHMEIGTYVGKSLQSEVSGNIIDLCPVGALTSKPFRFSARAWELNQYPSIAPHDCVGSNINIHTRKQKVMRVIPKENVAINETWISDRDRFSYEGLYHEDRITHPMIREGEVWQETSWEHALEFAVAQLKGATKGEGNLLGALASPNSTVEEFYLLQKLCRNMGSSNIDHRLRQVDFSDQSQMPVFPGLHVPFQEIEDSNVIVLIGSNIQKEQPLLSLRVRKAVKNNAQVVAINMMDYRFNFDVAEKTISAPHLFTQALQDFVNREQPELFAAGKKVMILLGIQAFNHPEASQIRLLANQLAKRVNGHVGYLTEGANAAGAWLAGCIPHRGPGGKTQTNGLNVSQMIEKPRNAYLFLNVEPSLDCVSSVAMEHALQAKTVIALSIFKDPLLMRYARVLLPMTPFSETSGTFVNARGEWQSFNGAALPFEEARPAWKILRVMANLLGLDGFDYSSSEEVLKEVKKFNPEDYLSSNTNRQGNLSTFIKDDMNDSFEKGKFPSTIAASAYSSETLLPESASKHPLETEESTFTPDASSTDRTSGSNTISRIGEVPLYATDNIVRRAPSLQATQDIIEGFLNVARIHPDFAKTLGFEENDKVRVRSGNSDVELFVMLDERVPANAAYIPAGLKETAELNHLFDAIEMQKL